LHLELDLVNLQLVEQPFDFGRRFALRVVLKLAQCIFELVSRQLAELLRHR